MEDVYKQDFSVRKVLGEIIGVSPAMVRLRRAIRKIARTRENVLLIGESGVGKRFFAQKIHLLGPNKHQPFVEIDCSLVYSHFSNGKELKIPIYKFAKNAIIRKYGEEFYKKLEATIQHLEK